MLWPGNFLTSKFCPSTFQVSSEALVMVLAFTNFLLLSNISTFYDGTNA